MLIRSHVCVTEYVCNTLQKHPPYDKLMSGDRVIQFMQDLCRMDRCGGRCMRKDVGVWEVLDINKWSEGQVISLRQRFPSISVHVEANRKSLGGFSLLLHQHRASHVWVSILVCTVMISVVLSLTRMVTFH